MAAEKGNKYAEGKDGPTKYNKEYDELAYKYCLLGATDSQLADFFEVTETTINNWKISHPSFFESIRAGKDYADIKVAKSLYDSCNGAVVKKQKVEKIKNIDPKTGKIFETVEVVDYFEQMPSDVNAIKFWLTNRQKNRWKNRQATDITTDGKPIVEEIDYDKLSTKTLLEIENASTNKPQ